MEISMTNPPSRTKDFFASPALSLSLAGVFRGAAAAAASAAEEGEEESVGGSGGGGRECLDAAVEISSENTGPTRSDEEAEADEEQEDEDADQKGNKKKKRKKYHRHTAEQIKEMEALFKESPHPDENQRQQLSKQLGLAPRQIKFWFQNRRTQIKAIQERHENSLLKTEIEKLQEENRSLRETVKNARCPSCGFVSTTPGDASVTTEDQQLRIENARLKAEIEKLRATLGKFPGGTSSPTSSCSAGNDQDYRSSLDYYTGLFGLEKPRILEVCNAALEELKKMATSGEPLWFRSVETGREILNYDEYVREFSHENMISAGPAGNGLPRRAIEASRDSAVVFVDLPRLVQIFMDVKQWKEMFPFMISKAATVDVISIGEGDTKNGAIQLMFAEVQMLTPMVATREVYFIRFSKQLSPDAWAIVDVSVDKLEENIDASLEKCRKRPSGCIIQDKCNGHCKVIWVEHVECQKSTVHSLYRSIVNSGMAFGAKHWIATLQLQCEMLVFFMATNVPTKDSLGVTTLAGRRSILKLAQRMTSTFCRSVGASSYHTWTKLSTKDGDGIRVASRKNVNDPGEPVGLILCAVCSVWLPVAPTLLFEFLKDETRRNEWDIMYSGNPFISIANLVKSQDRGNSVTVYAPESSESSNNSMWVIQDNCTNSFESLVVYAPVNTTTMQSVITGCDSGGVAVLPSGFSVLPDGLDSRPLVITSSRSDDRSTASPDQGGSLLTVAFQVLANASPAAKLTMESVETVNTLLATTLQRIKTGLQCEDGY